MIKTFTFYTLDIFMLYDLYYFVFLLFHFLIKFTFTFYIHIYNGSYTLQKTVVVSRNLNKKAKQYKKAIDLYKEMDK